MSEAPVATGTEPTGHGDPSGSGDPAGGAVPAVADATLPDDETLLEATQFPPDEFPDPSQEPVDLGQGA